MSIAIGTSIDLTGAATGLGQLTSMVDTAVANMNRKMMSASAGIAAPLGIGGPKVGQIANEMEKMVGLTGRLNQGLDRMTTLFAGGLGFGIALGGIGLFTAALTRSIEKAREFQTAQIAIAATIQSAYKIGPPGGKVDWTTSTNPVDRARAFQVAQLEASKLNAEIIRRQAKNILTYEEELQAFQSSLAPGARKGLSTKQVLNISEQAAIVAKSIGLRGEEIANASRLLMGGGVNVARSTIGRVLGVSNADITGKAGPEFEKFINERLKGFKAAQQPFAVSIEGIMSTLQAQLDVFLASVGDKLMKRISGSIQSLGKTLEGPGAEKFGDMLADLFESVAKGIESIAKSPAIPMIMKFISFLASNGDKIVIGIALMALMGVITKVGGTLKTLVGWFGEVAVAASSAAGAVDGLAMATNSIGGTGVAMAGRGGRGAAGRMTTASEIATAAEAEVIAANRAAESAFVSGKWGGGKGNVAAGARGAFRDPTTGKFISKSEAALRTSRGRALAGEVQMDAFSNVLGADYLTGKIPGVMGPMQQATLRERIVKTFGTEGAMAKKMLGLAETNPAMATKIMGAMSVGGKMGQSALKAFIGTQIAGMVLPEKITGSAAWDIGTNAFIGGSAIKQLLPSIGMGTLTGAGATLGTGAGALLAGGGAGAAAAISLPLIAAIGGGLIGTKIRQSVWSGIDEPGTAAKIAAGRKWQEKQIPLAVKHEDLLTRKREIEKAIKSGGGFERETPNEMRAYNPQHWLGDTTFGYMEEGFGTTKEKGTGFSPTQLKKSLAYINAQLKDTEEVQRAVITSNARGDIVKGIIAKSQTLQTSASLGWGVLRQKQDIESRRMAEQAKLLELYNAPDTGIPLDKDLKTKLTLDYFTKGTTLNKQYGGKKLSAADMDKALTGAGQDLMYQRKTREINEKFASESLIADMQRKQLIGGAGLKTIGQEYTLGRQAIEIQMAQSKGTLGADYKATLNKALHAFDVQFNKPLKEIEQQMGNLQLGVSSQHVVEAAQLAFKAVRAKIKQAVQLFKETGEGMTPEQGQQALREQEAQMKADVYKAMASKQFALGTTPEARIMNAAISEVAQQGFANKGEMFKAKGFDMSSGMTSSFAQIEAFRRSPGVTAPMVNQFAQDSINNNMIQMQRRIEDARAQQEQNALQQKYAPLQTAQAEMGVKQAQFGKDQRMMTLTDYDQARWATAEREVRYEEAQKRGPQTYEDIKKKVQEGFDIQKQQDDMAIQGAQANKEGVALQQKINERLTKRLDYDLGKLEKDYARAVEMATAYLSSMGKKGGGKPTKSGKSEESEGPAFDITINGGGFTEADVDKWIPRIREKLCQEATRSGSRK